MCTFDFVLFNFFSTQSLFFTLHVRLSTSVVDPFSFSIFSAFCQMSLRSGAIIRPRHLACGVMSDLYLVCFPPFPRVQITSLLISEIMCAVQKCTNVVALPKLVSCRHVGDS